VFEKSITEPPDGGREVTLRIADVGSKGGLPLRPFGGRIGPDPLGRNASCTPGPAT